MSFFFFVLTAIKNAYRKKRQKKKKFNAPVSLVAVDTGVPVLLQLEVRLICSSK